MNFRLIAALVALSGVGSLSAQLNVQVQNYSGGTPAPLFTASGTILPVGTGSVAVGSFNLTASEIANLFNAGNVAALEAAFTRLGNASNVTGLGANLAGMTQFTASGNTPASGLGGDAIYIVVSAGALFNATAEHLIFASSSTFPVVEAPAQNLITAQLFNTAGTVVVGGYGNFSANTLGTGAAPGFNTVAPIPEPSAMALLGLGVLAGVFVIRRRR